MVPSTEDDKVDDASRREESRRTRLKKFKGRLDETVEPITRVVAPPRAAQAGIPIGFNRFLDSQYPKPLAFLTYISLHNLLYTSAYTGKLAS